MKAERSDLSQRFLMMRGIPRWPCRLAQGPGREMRAAHAAGHGQAVVDVAVHFLARERPQLVVHQDALAQLAAAPPWPASPSARAGRAG